MGQKWQQQQQKQKLKMKMEYVPLSIIHYRRRRGGGANEPNIIRKSDSNVNGTGKVQLIAMFGHIFATLLYTAYSLYVIGNGRNELLFGYIISGEKPNW